MPKFFLPDKTFDISDTFEISGADAHHISKTLRMKVGDSVIVTGGDCTDHHCTIDSFSPSSVFLRVNSKSVSKSEGSIKISLFQALVKGDKMDTVIQKAVELGVWEIYPVAAERSVVKTDRDSARKKAERWNKIALEAAKQCGRGIIPTVHEVISFKECAERLSLLDARFICYENAEGKTVKDIITRQDISTLGFYIGPEGGVSQSEANLAFEMGIEAVSLGKLILRTETAGPAVMAMILYEKQL